MPTDETQPDFIDIEIQKLQLNPEFNGDLERLKMLQRNIINSPEMVIAKIPTEIFEKDADDYISINCPGTLKPFEHNVLGNIVDKDQLRTAIISKRFPIGPRCKRIIRDYHENITMPGEGAFYTELIFTANKYEISEDVLLRALGQDVTYCPVKLGNIIWDEEVTSTDILRGMDIENKKDYPNIKQRYLTITFEIDTHYTFGAIKESISDYLKRQYRLIGKPIPKVDTAAMMLHIEAYKMWDIGAADKAIGESLFQDKPNPEQAARDAVRRGYLIMTGENFKPRKKSLRVSTGLPEKPDCITRISDQGDDIQDTYEKMDREDKLKFDKDMDEWLYRKFPDYIKPIDHRGIEKTEPSSKILDKWQDLHPDIEYIENHDNDPTKKTQFMSIERSTQLDRMCNQNTLKEDMENLVQLIFGWKNNYPPHDDIQIAKDLAAKIIPEMDC